MLKLRMPNMNKKAVSPLIATVLLIAFAVSLGAVVIQWGSNYVRERTDDTSQRSDIDLTCSQDTYIGVIKYNTIEQLCYNVSSITAIVENGPYIPLEAITVFVFGNTTVAKLNVSNGTMAKNEVKRFEILFSDSPVKQVRLIPSVKVGGNVVACPRSALIRDDIPPC